MCSLSELFTLTTAPPDVFIEPLRGDPEYHILLCGPGRSSGWSDATSSLSSHSLNIPQILIVANSNARNSIPNLIFILYIIWIESDNYNSVLRSSSLSLKEIPGEMPVSSWRLTEGNCCDREKLTGRRVPGNTGLTAHLYFYYNVNIKQSSVSLLWTQSERVLSWSLWAGYCIVLTLGYS